VDSEVGRTLKVPDLRTESGRSMVEPNIDDLLTIVTESVEAYNLLSARLGRDFAPQI
jgi:hypothetical protein